MKHPFNTNAKKAYTSPTLRTIEIGSQRTILDTSTGDTYEAPKNIYKNYYEEHTQVF